MAKSKNSSQHNQAKKNHKNGHEFLISPPQPRRHPRETSGIQPREELELTRTRIYSIKKPITHRYPSLKGTDPKFRRNHRHALHGTMKALVRWHITYGMLGL
ncbi:hypothetical protein K432DRAFT_431142 [Lepidopterella palustris CBS 459.81]|uniref:60S ribosomal protein L29 n=1 Tax=Lepidopterella palustris CBS 459.81 TaxID=1314670 RepID=A0A8E2ELU2_9PEZI|nr:hypothetical protein K432DRAFT_431142 [Lepidopterella palustris CBS 459.81]